MTGSPEALLYLNEHLHTGHLRHASSELVKRLQDVVDFYMERVVHIEPIPENCLPPLIIRKALSPGNLKGSTKGKWSTTEECLRDLLIDLRIFKNPHIVDYKIDRTLSHLPEFHTTKEALLFLRATFGRLNYLLSDTAQQRLDSLKLGGYAYVESRVLNKAVFSGVYLVKPNYN